MRRSRNTLKNNRGFKIGAVATVMTVFVVLLSIGYSAFSTNMNINDVVANVKYEADIRITSATLSEAIDSSITDIAYNNEKLGGTLSMPTADSSVILNLEITNLGNMEMGIVGINNLPSNLDYEFIGYNKSDKICDSTDKCSLGIKKEIQLKIKYKENGYDSSNTTYFLDTELNFQPFYTVTYTSIINNGYPTEVIGTSTLKIDFGSNAPRKIKVKTHAPEGITETTDFTYVDGIFTMDNIWSDIEIVDAVLLASSSSGNVILTNSVTDSNLFNYKIYGNSVQQTYTGRNLFSYQTLVDEGFVDVLDEKTGEIQFKQVYSQLQNKINAKANTAYYVSFKAKAVKEQTVIAVVYYTDGSAKSIVVQGVVGEYVSGSGVTDKAKTIDYVTFGGSGGLAVGTCIKELQISTTNAAYEPYVGGKSAPNPAYPQEIYSMGNYDEATGKYIIPIKVTGKNLMNTSNAILNGGTKTAIENGFKLVPTDKTGGNISSNNYGRFIHNNNGNKDLYLEAGTYTISYDVNILEYSNAGESATQFSHFIYLSDSATEIGSAVSVLWTDFSKGKITYTFTLDAPKWVTYAVRLNGMTVEITNMQLEKGTTATSYEPYVTPETYSISLDEPLRCVGSDCDYIDFKENKVVRIIYDKQLTDKLAWQDSWYPTLLIYLNESETAKNAKNTKVMSNYGTNPYVGIQNSAGRSLGFGSSDTYWGFENVSDLKTWLTDKNFMVYYPLLTPIETSIDLPNIKLFDGTNDISIDTEIKPSNLEVKYY